MPASAKRHYRVAQRDKEVVDSQAALTEESIFQITVWGLVMYATSVSLAFLVGMLLGKSRS